MNAHDHREWLAHMATKLRFLRLDAPAVIAPTRSMAPVAPAAEPKAHRSSEDGGAFERGWRADAAEISGGGSEEPDAAQPGRRRSSGKVVAASRPRLQIDRAGAWRQYAAEAWHKAEGWSFLGTVRHVYNGASTAPDQVGALVRAKATGTYYQINGNRVRALDQRAVRAALLG